MAPLLLFGGRRYSPLDCVTYPLPIFGFILFTIYMRLLLTPISAMSWANLNHTLCGIDNDPWRVLFGMHKYFYFWAEAYLMFTSTVISVANGYLGSYLCQKESSSITTEGDD